MSSMYIPSSSSTPEAFPLHFLSQVILILLAVLGIHLITTLALLLTNLYGSLSHGSVHSCHPACWCQGLDLHHVHQEVRNTLAAPICHMAITSTTSHSTHGIIWAYGLHVLRARVPHHGAHLAEARSTVHSFAGHRAVTVTVTFSTSVRTVTLAGALHAFSTCWCCT